MSRKFFKMASVVMSSTNLHAVIQHDHFAKDFAKYLRSEQVQICSEDKYQMNAECKV